LTAGAQGEARPDSPHGCAYAVRGNGIAFLYRRLLDLSGSSSRRTNSIEGSLAALRRAGYSYAPIDPLAAAMTGSI
jgi:hypothetical protein